MKYLLYFGFNQAKSCSFAALIFIILALTKMMPEIVIPRYDLMLFLCVTTQFLMILLKLESLEDLKAMSIFHIVGLTLEIYKVHMGSWSYPEFSYLKILDVPLYSGFMYAAVGSYIIHAWKNLELSLVNYPPLYISSMLGFIIYINFFTHHYIYDFRYVLIILLFVVFFKSVVYFRVNKKTFQMPLTLSFLLIGFFIWIAENIATYFGAWAYPDQIESWSIVHISKIISWFLLVIISFLVVAYQKKGIIK